MIGAAAGKPVAEMLCGRRYVSDHGDVALSTARGQQRISLHDASQTRDLATFGGVLRECPPHPVRPTIPSGGQSGANEIERAEAVIETGHFASLSPPSRDNAPGLRRRTKEHNRCSKLSMSPGTRACRGSTAAAFARIASATSEATGSIAATPSLNDGWSPNVITRPPATRTTCRSRRGESAKRRIWFCRPTGVVYGPGVGVTLPAVFHTNVAPECPARIIVAMANPATGTAMA